MKLNLFDLQKVLNSSTTKKILLLMSTITVISVCFANPVLDRITNGVVVVNQTPNNTQVIQSSQQAILEWQSFNIASGQTTQFVQPNVNAVALNRISPLQGASQIFGTLNANGIVILVNGAGIHFGNGSTINVGGLIASTSDISNANFLAGKYIFDQPTNYNASIINEGRILATHHGLIALIGQNIQNNGLIRASLGSVVLATGDKFTLDFYGDELINFSVNAPASRGGRIKNTGSIFADGGKILISAQAAQGVLDNVIDMQGVTQANTVAQHNGEIILSANQGTIRIAGKLSASGNRHHSGGNIKVLGNNIEVTKHAIINVNGNSAGSILLAGMNSTLNNLTAANKIDLNAGSLIEAKGLSSAGNGGVVKVAANTVKAAGTINASSKAATGGSVTLAGNAVTVAPSAIINTNGAKTGGEITIGSDAYLASELAKNSFVDINAGSLIEASATEASGFGGLITILSDKTYIDGVLDVSAKFADAFAGTLQVSGNNVYLDNLAFLNASGFAGAGQIILNANDFTAAYGSIIDASALNSGNGGLVTILAQNKINLAGKIFAQGGIVSGNGGSINIAANHLINMNGLVNAAALATASKGGTVSVISHKTDINGAIVVAAKQANSVAGQVKILGQHVILGNNTVINAQGAAGGGKVNIGGNQQGEGPLLNALNTTIGSGSVIDVSALTNGNGGQVVIWSQNQTDFGGKILAEAGAVSGNGGFVEVSSHGLLNYTGTVNTQAAHGKTGTLLLDPSSVTIQDSPTPSSTSSVLTVATLQNALATSNVLVQTGTSGTEVGDITVANNVMWSNANTLTLSAFRNINVNATIANNKGGSLILNADNTRNGTGTINFSNNGAVNFSGGGIVSLSYNTNSIAHPNFYNGNVSVSNGTQLIQHPLNALTTAQNNAVITSIVQMTSYVPYIVVSSTLPQQPPIDTSNANVQPQTVTTMDNDLETVVEPEEKPIQFELASSTKDATQIAENGVGCAGKAACTTTDFIIK